MAYVLLADHAGRDKVDAWLAAPVEQPVADPAETLELLESWGGEIG